MITLSPKIFNKDYGLCKKAHAQEHEKKKRKKKRKRKNKET
jgi:hypothetical protein